MSKRWKTLSCLGLCATLLFTGCGSVVHDNANVQVENESSQVETIDEQEGQATNQVEEGVQENNGSTPHLNDLQPPEGVDYKIGDDNFVADTDQIFNHLSDYVGHTLQYEGMITHLEDGGAAIIRLYDLPHEEHAHEIFVGMNVVYSDKLPKEKTWVRATGVIEEGVDEASGETYPILQILSLEEIPAGQEKVYS